MADESPKHVLQTGPISGEVTINGKTYDITPGLIEVESQEIALAIAHQIGLRHRINSHPDVEGEFVYDENVGKA